MADYQEYRRRILHRRWRRMFITAALLILLVLLAAVGVLWKRLHREPAPNTAQGPTILQQELTGSEWNTISYTPARRLSVQTLDNGMTAMDFRLAAQPASPAVERSSFSDVSFLGDSLTQGMQLYDTGLPNAHFCAYKGVGPYHVLLLLEFVRALVFMRGAGSMPGRARWGCWQASYPCWGSCVAGVFARLLSSEPGRVLRCGAVGDGSLSYGRLL